MTLALPLFSHSTSQQLYEIIIIITICRLWNWGSESLKFDSCLTRKFKCCNSNLVYWFPKLMLLTFIFYDPAFNRKEKIFGEGSWFWGINIWPMPRIMIRAASPWGRSTAGRGPQLRLWSYQNHPAQSSDHGMSLFYPFPSCNANSQKEAFSITTGLR